ncbi:hypothetical protein KO465_06600 [Candidatus Micrarchaeota archaeon]|nr:hypothetical protein [Candidatus Micrarchaeota archaeon]
MFGIFGKKGSVDIKIDKFDFNFNESIAGKVILKVDKPVKAKELRICLKGERTIKKKVNDKGKVRTQINKKILHDFKLVLDEEKEYYGEKEYNFEISLPDPPKNEAPGGILGDAVKFMNAMSMTQVEDKWYLEASLDVPFSGDVSKKVRLTVK